MSKKLNGLAIAAVDPALRLEDALSSELERLGFRRSEGLVPIRVRMFARDDGGQWCVCEDLPVDGQTLASRLARALGAPLRGYLAVCHSPSSRPTFDARAFRVRADGTVTPAGFPELDDLDDEAFSGDAWEQNAQRLHAAVDGELVDGGATLLLGFEPVPEDDPLPPRLLGLLQEIRAASRVELEEMMGQRFVRITHEGGARRMAAVNDAELALLRQRATIPSPE